MLGKSIAGIAVFAIGLSVACCCSVKTGTPDKTETAKSADAALTYGRYVLSDDFVLDEKTGLTWQRSAAPEKMTWKDGKKYCEELSIGSLSDWRLPKKRELRTLQLKRKELREIQPEGKLPDCRWAPGVWQGDCSWHWSCSPHRSKSYYAWYVSTFTGMEDYHEEKTVHNVRCVTGAHLPDLPDDEPRTEMKKEGPAETEKASDPTEEPPKESPVSEAVK